MQREGLGNFVLVDDLAHAHTDFVLTFQASSNHRRKHFLEVILGRFEQGFALVGAKFGELRIATGDQALARIIRMLKLEEIALIEQVQLQLPLLDERADRDALQGADPINTQLLAQRRSNYRRIHEVVRQIIRHRFLDPHASADVIAQKLRQCGLAISTRSVERVIQEFGLQKNSTAFVQNLNHRLRPSGPSNAPKRSPVIRPA